MPKDVPPENVIELAPGVYETPDENEGSVVEERPPAIPTPTIAERARSASDRMRELRSVGGRLSRKNKATGPKRPRTSVAGFISTVWQIGARTVQPWAWPVANVLKIQSTVAGEILEDTVKGTAADAILQPLARIGQGSQVAFALLGPPILVGIATVRPETQSVIEPMLREALRSWLVVAGPKMLEHAEKEREFQEKYGADIETMIKLIFTPPEGLVLPPVQPTE